MFKDIGLFIIVVACVVVGSWLVNMSKLTDCDFEAPYKCEVIHGIGVIPVISIATAWIDIPEGEVAP